MLKLGPYAAPMRTCRASALRQGWLAALAGLAVIFGQISLALAAESREPTSASVTAFAGSTAADKRTATLTFSGGGPDCKLESAGFGAPNVTPPSGIAFPDGLIDFTATGCIPASTLHFTLIFSTPLPPGARYWKYGRTSAETAPHWYELPALINGNTVTFDIRDGGPGDGDLAANGVIVGRSGVGIGATMAPPAPEGLMVVGGNNHVSLRWNPVPSATGYTVKRATRHGGPYAEISANQTGPLYTDDSKANGATYYYVVSARNGSGEGPNSAEVYAMPIAEKAATACGAEPVTNPRTIRCPPETAGSIIEEEVYVCQGTHWQSTGWRVKESSCKPLDLGSAPITTF